MINKHPFTQWMKYVPGLSQIEQGLKLSLKISISAEKAEHYLIQ